MQSAQICDYDVFIILAFAVFYAPVARVGGFDNPRAGVENMIRETHLMPRRDTMRGGRSTMLRLDIRWGLAVAVLVLAMAAHASAQRLMETDGIELLGSVRVVTDAAATCNVVEASHTEAEYERIQANHGQPLDVWQLDFSVYNGSGRWLDHLIARYGIEAKWPDCTNWSGDGPGGGPTGTYSEPVLWASTIGRIQETGRNVVAPGATLTATTFILSFHEGAPRFANWSVDFTFGDSVTAGGAETEAAESTGAGRGVPAEIGRGNERGGVDAAAVSEAQENLFWQSIMNSTNPAEFKVYLDQFPNGVFRALAQNRLVELSAPAGDAPVADEPRGVGAGAPAVSAPPAAGRDAPLRAGETRVFDGMEFVWVPAGEFRMGSTSSEALTNEQPVTQVRISKGFWLAKYEVTQAEWQAVMGSNPSLFAECGRSCPVEQVSWDDAQEFIGSLNARSGGNRYRLPTEAEWEYAARAGTTGDRYGNLDGIGWCADNSGGRTHPGGGKAPNAFGLHDMIGNVYEWVEDWYGDYPGGAVTDPGGAASGSPWVFRGGGWIDGAGSCRSSYRYGGARGNDYLGFRLLRTE